MSAIGIQLSSPTNRTVEGPQIQFDRGGLIVKYDYQSDDGSIKWEKILFFDVLSVEYNQAACCSEDSVVSAREIRTTSISSRLTEMTKRWKESVGWQDWQQEQGGASRFKHFTIFFDDAGCVEVIAASCEVREV